MTTDYTDFHGFLIVGKIAGTGNIPFPLHEQWIIVFKKASSLQPLSPLLITCSQKNPHPIFNFPTTFKMNS